MFYSIISFFWGILFFYCSFCVIYLFLFSLAGHLAGSSKAPKGDFFAHNRRIALLVPAFREDGVILSTVNNLIRLKYPSNLFDVFIVADSFRKETLMQLRKLPITVLEVAFDKSTKTKALNAAFEYIQGPYDIALICDADNVLPRDFLSRISSAFANGAKAVQGRRVAKNLDSSFAILDACSEGINNHIFRKGANALGLSSSVIGSGMAFEYNTVKAALKEIRAVGGFDKVLQLKLVQQGIRIQYLEDALIFDEKIESAEAFRNQRKRWVSSQFIYFCQFFRPAFQLLLKRNFSYFNLAILSSLVLPRAFLFVLLPVLFLAATVLGPLWLLGSAFLCAIYIVTLWIALPSDLLNRDLLTAFVKLPNALWIMMGTVLQVKQANKKFIHTLHSKTKVQNVLFEEHRD